MKKALIGIAASFVLASLAGCYVYDPYYGQPQTVMRPASYQRSWDAALGAMRDQGLQIGTADQAAGVIEGRRGGLIVKARVISQADGAVRVEFNTTGDLQSDPGMSDRVSRAYDARMGR
ncbi:MAG TPA: hypothetical protein VLT89_01830 [Usitatibacter sp.]|nr:hypothetical protein [Usitatibacter sp.]